MDSFFNPKSVAIIGASHTPGKLGYYIFENFVRGGYNGNIYAVNPDTTPILGRNVFSSIKEIPGEIELSIVVVPAKIVPRVLSDCIKKKVKSVVIISAGFSETGKEGRRLEDKCKKIITKKKIRIIGPNCIGVFDSSSKVDTLFLSQERLGRPAPGNIAFISQSGAVGSTILDWLSEERVGISKFISYGNAMDVNELDLMHYLSEDANTKVIAVYLEGIRSEGKKFLNTVKIISKKKPIIILKAGKTEKGTRAVVSHTGSLAGSAKVYSAVFKQSGVIEAENWEELFDYAKAFSMQNLPKGNKIAIITDGGGFGVLATDECERQGIQLPEPSERLKSVLRKTFPSYATLHNPIDLTGDANAERYGVAISECLKEFDGVIAITLFQVPTLEEKVVDIIINLSKYGKPILCCAAGGKFTKKLSTSLESNGIPVYPTPERAVRAYASLVRHAQWLK